MGAKEQETTLLSISKWRRDMRQELEEIRNQDEGSKSERYLASLYV